jgi:tRNA(adenine34) deaminase
MTMAFPTPMAQALFEAQQAAQRGEVPVGAVVVRDGAVIAAAGNHVVERKDPTAHAEILAIQMACAALDSERLIGCDLYVTLEPCPMCAAAISFARIARLYFGADDPKSGGVVSGPRIFNHSSCHHAPDIYDGIEAQASAKLLQDFFRARR